MNTVVIQLRDRARGGVSAPMLLWSLVMAVVLFDYFVGGTSRAASGWVGVVVTFLFGVYLGWRRRVGMVVVAPFFSWLVAWFPIVVASMIHRGVIVGLVVGLVSVTIGWFVIGGLELLWLGLVALTVARLRGGRGPDVVVFGPGDGPR